MGPRQETQPELEEATAQSRAHRSVQELLELETDNALQHARKFAEQATGGGKTVSPRQLVEQMTPKDEQDQDMNVMRRPRSSQQKYERQRAREEKLRARRLTREQDSHWLESGRVRVPKRDPSQKYEEEVSRAAAGPGLEGGRPTTSQQSEPGDALGVLGRLPGPGRAGPSWAGEAPFLGALAAGVPGRGRRVSPATPRLSLTASHLTDEWKFRRGSARAALVLGLGTWRRVLGHCAVHWHRVFRSVDLCRIKAFPKPVPRASHAASHGARQEQTGGAWLDWRLPGLHSSRFRVELPEAPAYVSVQTGLSMPLGVVSG